MTTMIHLGNLQVEIVGVSGAIMVVVVFAIKMIAKRLKEIRKFLKWLSGFVRDWQGEEAEAGRDRVPGVMERLNRLDGELSRNGGKSLKDVVVRLETKMDKLFKRLDELENKISNK